MTRSFSSQIRKAKELRRSGGNTLPEVMVSSVLLAITSLAVSSAMIDAQRTTQRSGLRSAAESYISSRLDADVRRRFFTFRCSQGPCLQIGGSVTTDTLTSHQDKPLMYYTASNSAAFQSSCKDRRLAADLLSETGSSVTAGTTTLSHSEPSLQGVTLTRRVSLPESGNQNKALVVHEASYQGKILSQSSTVLIPNAANWCS